MAISTPKRTAAILANQALRPKMTSMLELVGAREALSYLETPFPHQRPLRSYHVTYLRHLMKSRHFRQGTEIHVANVSGTRYVVNGQHTLSAIIYEQCSIWLSVVEYTCTMEEAHRLYQTFDRNLQRSLTDLYRADPGFEAIQLLPSSVVRLGNSITNLMLGFPAYATGFRDRTPFRDAALRFACMLSWQKEAQGIFQVMHGPRHATRVMERAAVISVALCTYRWQPAKADVFWTSVASDSGLLEGDPAKTMLNWLLTTHAQKYELGQYSRYVATAWNAHYEERSLIQLRARAATDPILIAGTPHDGNALMQYLGPDMTIHHDPIPAT